MRQITDFPSPGAVPPGVLTNHLLAAAARGDSEQLELGTTVFVAAYNPDTQLRTVQIVIYKLHRIAGAAARMGIDVPGAFALAAQHASSGPAPTWGPSGLVADTWRAIGSDDVLGSTGIMRDRWARLLEVDLKAAFVILMRYVTVLILRAIPFEEASLLELCAIADDELARGQQAKLA